MEIWTRGLSELINRRLMATTGRSKEQIRTGMSGSYPFIDIAALDTIREGFAKGDAQIVLTRDLSASGIRLIGTRRLLGQKVTVRLGGFDFQVRILWTCPVGDDLVENGGTFLGVTPAP